MRSETTKRERLLENTLQFVRELIANEHTDAVPGVIDAVLGAPTSTLPPDQSPKPEPAPKPKPKDPEKRRQWTDDEKRDHIEAATASGNRSRYFEENGIPPSAFYKWRKQIRKRDKTAGAKPNGKKPRLSEPMRHALGMVQSGPIPAHSIKDSSLQTLIRHELAVIEGAGPERKLVITEKGAHLAIGAGL